MNKFLWIALVWQPLNVFSQDFPSAYKIIKPPHNFRYDPGKLKVEPPEHPFDLRKLRNHWPYLAEGKGGMGVLLLEKSAMISRVLGRPTRQSFETYDELYFDRRTFSGSIYVYKGIITRLRYIVNLNAPESLKFKTAAGLRQEMLETLSEDDAKKFILDFYKNPGYLTGQGSLVLYTLGISFHWSNGKLRYIDLFEPWEFPANE